MSSAGSAGDRGRDRGFGLGDIQWVDDPLELARRPGIDAVVELIGGSDGIARELVETALAAGRHVVTANKALRAHPGTALARLADGNGWSLRVAAALDAGLPLRQ